MLGNRLTASFCLFASGGAVLESPAFRGAVAQLGERRVRNAKVEGSIPFRSTIPFPFRGAPQADELTDDATQSCARG